MIEQVKSELAAAFSIVDIGPISFYLRLKVERDQGKRTIKLSQLAYIDKILSRFDLDKANAVSTVMKENVILQMRTKGQASTAERERYQGMIGSIMFSMVETRPNVAFATSVTSRFAKNPGHQHMEVVKTILRDLKKNKRSRNHVRRPGSGRSPCEGLLGLRLSRRQREPKIDIRLHFYANRWPRQLLLQETTHSGTIIHRSVVHCSHLGR